MPAPILHSTPRATAAIIAFGSTEAAVLEAQQQLAQEHDLRADYLRIRALPFTDEVRSFVDKYDEIFVVEMNRDGQLAQLLTIEYPEHAVAFKSVAFSDGLPASARWVREGILAMHTASPRARQSTSRTKATAGNPKTNGHDGVGTRSARVPLRAGRR